jgi:light-regulated signal transduction histidine kinase (bacteriophytochrome)
MVTLYSQMILRRYGETFEQEAHLYFDYIQSGARRMQSLIADLVLYSRLIANQERRQFAPVDMNDVVRTAKDNCQTALAESVGAISYERLPSVEGDFEPLVQVFQNLISNAVKYRKAEEPPRVSIWAELDGSHWRFAVQDNGIGIKPEYHDRIFRVFKRLHGRDVPGTGMGLAVCKKIVEQHGGRIWVEGEPGKGATFFLTLPERSSS